MDSRAVSEQDEWVASKATARAGSGYETAKVAAALQVLDEATEALRQLRAGAQEVEGYLRHAAELLHDLAPEVVTSHAPVRSLLSLAEVADIIGVSRSQAGRLVRDGMIPSFRLGHRIFVSRDSLRDWEERLNAQGLG